MKGGSRRGLFAFALAATVIAAPRTARAQSNDDGLVAHWLSSVETIKKEQPTFITPMFSTTGRLVQAWRSDFTWRTAPDGSETTLYGSGKGLDFVPFNPIQFVFNVPQYAVHRQPSVIDGYGDWPLTMKVRLTSRGPSDGNDVVTALLGASIPTGGKANGAEHTVLTPQLAAGKGWGDFDIQASGGVGMPTRGADEIGHAITFNVAPQYHVVERVWTQLELNATTWRGGVHDGERQVFLSPGAYFGRFPVYQRVGLTVGVGTQIALTKFRQYDHAVDLSVLFPF